jgi:hypothetical protein|eukprot:COSAG06_NODE_2114_length_7559_cov_15.641019_4_plen_379_part_00
MSHVAEYEPLQPVAWPDAGGSDSVGVVERGSSAADEENPAGISPGRPRSVPTLGSVGIAVLAAAKPSAAKQRMQSGLFKVRAANQAANIFKLGKVDHTGWDVPDRNGPTADPEEDGREAPKWFESTMFKWLDDQRVAYPVYLLLGLTPFLTSLGSFLEMWFNCPTVSTHIEGMFALGTFLFTGVWIFYFHGLRQAVRGAHKVTKHLDVDKQKLDQLKQENEASEPSDSGEHMTLRVRVQTARHAKALERQLELDKSHAVASDADEVSTAAALQICSGVADDDLDDEEVQVAVQAMHEEFANIYTGRTNEDELLWMREKGYKKGRRATIYLKQQRFTKAEVQHIEKDLTGSGRNAMALGMDELREVRKTPFLSRFLSHV